MQLARKGNCLFCSECCKGVSLQLRLDRSDPLAKTKADEYLKYLKYHGINVSEQTEDVIELKLGTPCIHLKKEGDKVLCEIYPKEGETDLRPSVCLEFPKQPSIICKGFSFEEVAEGDAD